MWYTCVGELHISSYALHNMCYVNWGLLSLLHVMHMCREANLASSSSWMYIAYNHLLICLFDPFIDSLFRTKRGRKNLLICFYFNPFVDDWQKGGEVFEIYACFVKKIIYAYMFCFANRRKRIWCVLCLSACFISIHLHTCLWALLHIYCLFVMHELRGSFFEALL